MEPASLAMFDIVIHNPTADVLDDFVANLKSAVVPLEDEAHITARKGSMRATTYSGRGWPASCFEPPQRSPLPALVRCSRRWKMIRPCRKGPAPRRAVTWAGSNCQSDRREQ
jgi:hypothetical protein